MDSKALYKIVQQPYRDEAEIKTWHLWLYIPLLSHECRDNKWLVHKKKENKTIFLKSQYLGDKFEQDRHRSCDVEKKISLSKSPQNSIICIHILTLLSEYGVLKTKKKKTHRSFWTSGTSISSLHLLFTFAALWQLRRTESDKNQHIPVPLFLLLWCCPVFTGSAALPS